QAEEPPAGSRKAHRKKEDRWFSAGSLVPLVVMGLFVGVPFALILLNSFNTARPSQPADYGLQNWARAFDDPRIVRAIWNTVTLGVTRTIIAITVASALAWLIARTDMPGGRHFEFLFWLAFFIPALPLTLGWIGLMDPLYGTFNLWIRRLPGLGGLQDGPFNIYSFWGIIWVHITAMTIPYMVVLVTPAFRRMGALMEEAARMCGAGRFRTAAQITMPLMLPAIMGAVMLSFIRALQAFEVELLLGSPIGFDVYSTQIYRWIRYEPPQYGMATALGAGFMVIMLVLAVMYRRMIRGRDFTTIGGQSYSEEPVRLGRAGRWVAFGVMVAFFVVGVVAPVVFMIVGSFMTRYGWFHINDPFTTAHWARLFDDPIFVSAVWNTFVIATSAAVVGLVVYWWVAHVAVKSKSKASGAVDLMAWLPLAIPGILLGLGFLWLFLATPLRVVLYGSLIGLTIALVVGHLPTGTVQLKAALLQVSEQQEEAAAICGARKLTRYRKVMLPLLGPSVAAAAVLTFASAVRDISTVVLLASRRTQPLSLLMLEYGFEGRLESAAALGLLITMIMGVVTLIARHFSKSSIRRGAAKDPVAADSQRTARISTTAE
ncbi:MAG TPA: iron ABC transporter permease, partial [Thermoleophilia bacterium]|nr:iron ABC transporter permease [Thermoleophilia bacterium]